MLESRIWTKDHFLNGKWSFYLINSDHISLLSILKTGKAKAIRFTTLEAICEALECQPGDILEFVK